MELGFRKRNWTALRMLFIWWTSPGADSREALGWGLSICKKIMELHGGGLLFESGLGQGTSVKMRFPVYDEPEED